MVIVLAFIAAVGWAILVSIILALPVMLLWDWLMPLIFGLPEITWLQAWGLSLLCSLLFKNNTNVSSS